MEQMIETVCWPTITTVNVLTTGELQLIPVFIIDIPLFSELYMEQQIMVNIMVTNIVIYYHLK